MQRREIVFTKGLFINRRGLLYVGALRETLFISGLLTVVLMVLLEVKQFSKGHWSAVESDQTNRLGMSVLGFDLDEDRQSVVAYGFPETIVEFSTEDGTILSRDRENGLVRAAASAHNSTVVHHAQWTEKREIWSSISVTKNGDVVVTEEFEGDEYYPADAYVSSDGSIATLICHSGLCLGWGFSDNGVEHWRVQLSHAAVGNSMAPDGRNCVAITTAGEAAICDLKTGQPLVRLPDMLDVGRSMAWTLDGKKVAIASRSGLIRVFDTTNGQELWEKRFPEFNQRRLVFTRDGNCLAVAGLDAGIRIWNLKDDSNPPTILGESTSFVVDLAVTPHKSTLIAACIDGTIREWSLDTVKMIKQIR